MKKLRLLTLLCCLFILNQAFGQTVLVDYSSVWSYYDNANQPSNNGGFDWNDINYNASSWNQGSAQLGYGDSDENTVINSNTKTAYFRHNFNVTDPSSYDGVDLNLIYDDGAVVYLNGTEVWRVNMPSGSITYSTFASSSSSDNDIAITSISNLLVTGDNVLAVEVHQVSNSSSDISFDFKATASIPGAVNITRGPYLQKASASSMTVRWRTASSTQSIVKYGTNINNLNQTYSNTSPKTEHIAEINGLAPNTKYFYRIENSAAVLLPESTDIYFKTHPTIGSEQPITMWILGDCGTANNNQRDVRDAYYNYIGNNHTDGILFLGDNAYNDGTDAQYQNAIFSNMYESKLQNSVAWSCLGNHDGYTANSSSQSGPYYDIFSFPTAGESGGVASGTEAYYSFDYGNIHFIALESYETDRSVGGAMYNWALNDIQNTTQDWIVAYWHHPPYTKGSHDSDNESNLIDMRQNFLPMLESNGVDLVLSGHSHSYERSYFLNGHYGNANTFNSSTHTVGANGAGDGKSDGNGVYDKTVTGPEAGDGAVYITTGSSGKISGGSLNHQAMFYSVSQLGSCVLEVNGNQLDVKFVRETGSIDDYFTILKEEECVVGTSCDDGDPCTTNDTYDSNCICSGTALPDGDGDGICDAEDQCPTLDDALIGTSCDDGDSQTENDTWGNDCICAGVPCSPAGTSCDDGDPSTYNDVTDGSCNCAGIPCPIAGTSCDDGDPNTINDIEDGNCNCAGQNISTTTCITINSGGDDVEENEINGSMYSTSSDLELVFDTYQSQGNQTVGMRFNNVDVPQGATISNAYIQFAVDEADSGAANLTIRGEDTNNANAFSTSAYDITNRTKTQASVSWSPPDWNTVGQQSSAQQTADISTIIQEIVDRPGYSINNSMVIVITGTGVRTAESYDGSAGLAPQLCIEFSDCPSQGNACNDGDPCTINDIIDSSCNCIGTFQDGDGDGVCDADDICPGSDDTADVDNDGIPDGCDDCNNNTTGDSCDDGDACTTNDTIDANCNCVGTFQDGDGDGVCDADDICPGGDDNADEDNDGIPNACDPCDNTTTGDACDDNNDCTINDAIDADCNCVGTFQDGDGDGVCDADDICPGNDDTADVDNDGIPDGCDSCNNNTTGDTCDDGDACTTNDTIDANCNCVGTFQDGDGDGVCDADDICPGGDDNADEDNDGIPNACDSCDNTTTGDACDDNNDCTINDVIDADCNCIGTFQDSDGDGVCDADDQCEGSDDNLDVDSDGIPDGCDDCNNNTTGNACDDNNDCTINDAIDSNCNCVGTFQDGDGDGICDADDICPGGDDNADEDNDGIPNACDPCNNNTTGDACDDNNDCTINDALDADCNCVGTFQDGDGDGVCDADDQCEGSDDNLDVDNDGIPDGCDDCNNNTTGDVCDDNNDCTINDAIDANCNCVGTFQDGDGDGVCDADDICPGGDDNADEDNDGIPNACDPCDNTTTGDACDDNNDCTINDALDADCNCVGTFQDGDGDGVCDADDQCEGSDDNLDVDNDGIPDGCDDCNNNTTGDVCDDNNDCTINDAIDANCNCVGTFQDGDGDGVCDADDICPGGDDNADEDNDGIPNACDPCDNTTTGDACDDNNDCTINDALDADCNCVGTYQDGDGDGVCDADDICPGGDDNADEDNDGTPDACDSCNNNTTGDSCDDGDACTINDTIDANCNCVGTLLDSDNDGVCDLNDICPGGDDNADGDNDGIPDFCDDCDGSLTGTACNDNNDCTVNDVYDVDCNCAGTFLDSDGDGVCDADDICPGSDDTADEDNDGIPNGCDDCNGNTVGNTCDDGDACTTNDVLDANCNCVGTFQDGDGDGVCDTDDQCEGSDDTADVDNDGVPDGCDSCDNNTTGDSCDDNNDCTINDTIDADCNCVGTFQDADGDGVCDADDICPGSDDTIDSDNDGTPDGCDDCDGNTIGNACNDGDACTTNDVIDANCNCVGTFQDSDGDGVCDANDQCEGSDDNLDVDNDGIPDGCDSCNNNTTGNSCDDGNDCTINDVIDADCNCAGTFQDADGDGVCDADDICPGSDDTIDSDNDGTPDGCDNCDGNTIGNACNDGDPCTTNDVIDANCNCVGTFQDSDGDGVCDANDQCEGSDDNLDVDNDGIPDGCDSCNNNTTGNSCDDGNDCTINDVIDADCNCAGTFQDADGDGVCDADDICPGSDDTIDSDNDGTPDGCDNCDGNTIGNACNDGDPCTTNDVIDANCNCVGTFQDSDGDGVCDANDQCEGSNDNLDVDNDGIPDGCDSCNNNTTGNSCDDGDNCTINDVIDADCNCVGTFQDADGDGVCDADDICPGGDDNIDSDNDGTPDFCDTSCPDSDGDGVCDADDPCPNDEYDACTLPDYCTSSGTNTTYEYIERVVLNTIDNTSGDDGGYGDFTNLKTILDKGVNYPMSLTPGFASGAYTEVWNVWIDFNKDGDFEDVDELVLTASSNATVNSSITIPSNVSTGIRRIRVSMQYNSAPPACGTFTYGEVEDYYVIITNNCTEGEVCDDGDNCTENDVYDVDCNCSGTPIPDSDGDGICDIEDVCPGMDDALIGQSCDDGDNCTTNDVYNSSCNCEGVYQDSDGDGYCVGDDPDDNDPCNPDSDSGACTPCDEIMNHGFETNYGAWNDGGGDCTRRTQYPNTGIYSVRLRDNSGVASSMTSDPLNLSSYSEITLEFSYYPNSMENGEDFFLEISTDDGANYTIYQSWARGTDFNNGTRYDESVLIDDITLTSQTRLRLRCDASGNGDQIYVDDVILTGCDYASLIDEVIIDKLGNIVNDAVSNKKSNKLLKPIELSTYEFENEEDSAFEDQNEEVDFEVYPNPTRYTLNIAHFWNGENNRIDILDVHGQRIMSTNVREEGQKVIQMDVSRIPNGMYIVNLMQSNEYISSKRIVITNN